MGRRSHCGTEWPLKEHDQHPWQGVSCFCLGKPQLPVSQISSCLDDYKLGQKVFKEEGTTSGVYLWWKHPAGLAAHTEKEPLLLRGGRRPGRPQGYDSGCGRLLGEGACTSQCSSLLETLGERSCAGHPAKASAFQVFLTYFNHQLTFSWGCSLPFPPIFSFCKLFFFLSLLFHAFYASVMETFQWLLFLPGMPFCLHSLSGCASCIPQPYLCWLSAAIRWLFFAQSLLLWEFPPHLPHLCCWYRIWALSSQGLAGTGGSFTGVPEIQAYHIFSTISTDKGKKCEVEPFLNSVTQSFGWCSSSLSILPVVLQP